MYRQKEKLKDKHKQTKEELSLLEKSFYYKYYYFFKREYESTLEKINELKKTTKKIKKLFPNIPVIAQTAYSTKEEKEQAFLVGCDDFISKPIDNEEFNKVINKYLKK